jgi:hydrophobe/amphiphile efflux-1 (HAE1) family protein
MKFSHFFIERPAFAAVIAILITLVGVIAYPTLPIAQYPPIAPPTVTISATYPGASPEVLADTVASPIETQVNGVEDMLYMSSQLTGDGHMNTTVTFKLGTDIDKAQVLVENRVATALPKLPADVRNNGVVVRKSTPDILMAVHMYSPDGSLDQQYISNYVGLHIKDRLLRVSGVGDIQSRATRDYAMRIWIDPDRAAARNLTVEEIVAALQGQNLQVSAGALGAPPYGKAGANMQLNVETKGRLTTPQEFADIVVKRDAQGRLTRISDVARVELGAQDYTTNAYLSARPAVALPVFLQPGANALATADSVLAEMTRLKTEFPPGLDYRIVYNPTEYVRASFEEVEKTLFIALFLVVGVVLIFLQSWRAALIPVIAIPVSLIGTLAVMAAAGFSLNNLSMFGLVLAIGIVVDDAIVVVENVERHLREGASPKDAAHRTMDEVGGALVAIALVLSAVFVPTAFISGLSGQFYRQFALTIATATLISLIVSLTLSPALAALLLKPHQGGHVAPRGWTAPFARFADVFNRNFDRLSGRYAFLARRTVRMLAVMLALYAGLLALTGWRILATPQGFIPTQDQGNFILALTTPPGTSLQRTDAVLREVLKPVLNTPGVIAASAYAGVDALSQTTTSSAAQAFIVEAPFNERLPKGLTTDKIMEQSRKVASSVIGGEVRFIQQPPVRGVGSAGGFKMIIQDERNAGPQALEAAVNAVAAEARKSPAISTAFTIFNTKTPRLSLDVDRQKAETLGVSTKSVFNTLQTYLGSSYVGDISLYGKQFQVLAQADTGYRQHEADVLNLQTRSSSGAMAPLGAVATLKHLTGPYRVLRYNLFPAAEIQGDTAPGYSSGQSMAEMEAIAKRVLPDGFSYEWTELAYQQKIAGNTGGLMFVLAVVFVFLLLTALYESVTLPLAVILIVPMCILAAFLGVALHGQDNNILTQIGLVVLIGLAAKNAILIVEFARQAEEERKLDRRAAAEDAARTRLRPILMTSFAFILGVAPLAFAVGPGAEMRRALGVAVFYGMVGVTVFGLLFTPVFYVVCRYISDRLPQPPWRKRVDAETPEVTP